MINQRDIAGDTNDLGAQSFIVGQPDPNLDATLADCQNYWRFIDACFQLHQPSVLIHAFSRHTIAQFLSIGDVLNGPFAPKIDHPTIYQFFTELADHYSNHFTVGRT